VTNNVSPYTDMDMIHSADNNLVIYMCEWAGGFSHILNNV